MPVTSNSFAKTIKVSSDKSNINLYPHQMDAITNLNKKINSQEHFSGILVLPTGGGKTLTAVRWILKNIIDKGQKVLWVAHRHELLNQAVGTVVKNAYADVLGDRKSIQYRIISGIHDRPVNIKPEDDLLIASKDSINHGMNYLLNQWVKQNRNNIFLVIDEAHHAAAKTYRKTIEVLKKENPKSFKMLGLTATPFRTSEAENKILKEVFEDDIVYGIDLKALIARKILADPIFEELSTKLDVSKDLTEKDIKAIQAFDSIPEGVASNIAMSKERNNFIVNHYSENREKYGQLLVFALNIEHAIALKGLFEKRNIPSEFVVSSLKDPLGNTVSSKENEEKIRKFREEKINVLINVNILTEGIDLPNAQTVFLTRPTISTILMTQMIGRVLRGEKANGTEKHILSVLLMTGKKRLHG
ncbi:MAG: DEAD/DEAH box helicase [Clostridiaceae bacterium]|nr:DEAD/DEAH box helicase [Clostridiaceae bacterium]